MTIDAAELPLGDLRVLEIGYGIAAPMCARTLGQFGADVIRVESVRRPDSLRTSGSGWVPLSVPWEIRRDTNIGLNGFTSPEKRSVGLEIDTPEGMAAFRALVAQADVLVMNMSVEGVAHLGVGYDALREVNPSLIHLNLFGFGSDGPYRGFRTWGGNLSALAGVTASVGWPDRPPTGLPLSFPDYPSAMWGVVAVVAALLRRDETGEGCALELAQFQVAVECIGPSVAEAVLTGSAPERTGDRARGGAPDGVFPSRDAGRHVVVSVPDDDTWRRLGAVDGLGDLVDDPAFATAGDRAGGLDEIHRRLSEWTSRRTAWDAAWRLQEAGVPAYPVVDHYEVLRDEHLADRGFFQALPHARFDAELCYGQAVALSETPARHTRAAPAFGEHTREVLGELAGMDDAAVDALIAAGAAHEMVDRDVRLERPYLGWVGTLLRLPWPPATVDPADILYSRLAAAYEDGDA